MTYSNDDDELEFKEITEHKQKIGYFYVGSHVACGLLGSLVGMSVFIDFNEQTIPFTILFGVMGILSGVVSLYSTVSFGKNLKKAIGKLKEDQ